MAYVVLLLLAFALTNASPAQAESYGLPFRFEVNQGQAGAGAKFVAHTAGFTADLSEQEILLNLPQPIRMRFAGGSSNPKLEPQSEMQLRSNYYRGKTASGYTNIRNYERLVYHDVYPGIDAVFRGNGRQLEFDFIVSPAADPKAIGLVFTGHQEAAISNSGALVLKTSQGEAILHPPTVYQDHGGKRTPVAGRYTIDTAGRIGLEIAGYDATQPLVIDPVLSFSTYRYVGGDETPTGIAVDNSGNIYVSYTTFDAADFGDRQFVVHKIPRDGSAGYLTTIWELFTNSFANEIVIDAAGNAYIAGTADNTSGAPTEVPTVNAIQPHDAGGIDAFIAKLSPTGNILFSTYLGGSGNDAANAIALDGAGGLWIAGRTSSPNFPMRNAYQGAYGGGASDGFLTRLDTGGTAILYSTYIGGAMDDDIQEIRIDGTGNVLLGSVTGVVQCRLIQLGLYSPCQNVVVSKMNPAGTAILQTRGLADDPQAPNYLVGLALGPGGNAFVARAVRGEASDLRPLMILQKLDGGFQTIYSKEIFAEIRGIAVDGEGNTYLTGSDSGGAFGFTPVVNSFRPVSAQDLLVMKLPPDGSFPIFSTLLSGTCVLCAGIPVVRSSEIGHAVAVDGQNRVYVAGVSSGEDFPTTDGSRRGPMSMISQVDPVILVLDTTTPHTTTQYTSLEDSYPVVKFEGNWLAHNSAAIHSGSSAKLAMDAGSKFSVPFTGAGDLKWYGCKDEYAGIARVILDGAVLGTVDTYASPGACGQLIWSVAGLGPGPHTLTVEVTGTRSAASTAPWVWMDRVLITSAGDITLGTPPPSDPGGGSTLTRLEQDSPLALYTGEWHSNSNAIHSGGSAALAVSDGTRVTLNFSGTGVKWIGYADEWSGIAKVYIDGILKDEIDTYASPARARTVLYSIDGLAAGAHSLRIEATGRKRAASGGAWVWVDAFDVVSGGNGGGPPAAFTRVEQGSAAVQNTGSWNTHNASIHSGGSAILSLNSGDRATFTFTGTAVRWVGLKDEWSGMARVYVDGALRATVDTYSSSAQANTVLFTLEGLPAASHTIAVEVTGARNSAAASAWIWVDAFEYR